MKLLRNIYKKKSQAGCLVDLVWLKLSHANRLELKWNEWNFSYGGGCEGCWYWISRILPVSFIRSMCVYVCARVCGVYDMAMQTCVLANKNVIGNVGLHIVIDLLLLLYVFKRIPDWILESSSQWNGLSGLSLLLIPIQPHHTSYAMQTHLYHLSFKAYFACNFILSNAGSSISNEMLVKLK